MIELSLLGPQAVRRSEGQEFGSLPAQPKRFALLAYLAVAASGAYQRRDTIAAMFWPEMDQFAARRALRNTLYHLREALGDGVLITRGDDAVAIDPAVLTSDVAKLVEAFSAERYEEAVEYYRGELLAGLHFADAGEAFEDWLSRERTRIADLVVRAIRALVDREKRIGNVLAAAYWAQRACALAPGDEGWIRQAMSLLAQAGDRGGALRLHEAHVRRLAAEFDARPSAETQALASRIRSERTTTPHEPPPPGERSAPAGAPAARAPSDAGDRDDSSRSADLTDSSEAIRQETAAPASNEAPPPFDRRAMRGRRAAVWAAALAAIVAGIALLARAAETRHPDARSARTRVVVSVFDDRTRDPRYDMLGRMAQDWLTQGILRTQLVDVVDPRAAIVQGRTPVGAIVDPVTLAHRTGAAIVVSGSYYRAADSLFYQAAITDARSGRIVRVVGPIVTSARTPAAALNELRSRVMTALASTVDARMGASLPVDGVVPAFDAYQAYLEGWDAFWHGDGEHAEAMFEQAAHRDTVFVAAAVSLATAAGNYHHCALTDSLVRALDKRAPVLDRIDRLTLQIAMSRCHGRNEEMLRLTLERASLESRTSGVLMSAAAAAGWANRPAQELAILQRIDPATDLGWSTDSLHLGYWGSLTDALHALGRHEEELSAADRVSLAAPLTRAWLRGSALAALGRRAEVLAVVDTALTLPTETANNVGLAPYGEGRPEYSTTAGWVAVWIARELAVHGDPATSRQVASRALAWYRARPAVERATPEERLVEVWTLELMGAYADGEQVVRQLSAEDSTNVDYEGELGGLAAERGDTALSDSLDRWLAAQSEDRVGWSASYYRARNAALLGRSDQAIAELRESINQGAWLDYLRLDPAFVRLRGRRDFDALVEPKD